MSWRLFSSALVAWVGLVSCPALAKDARPAKMAAVAQATILNGVSVRADGVDVPHPQRGIATIRLQPRTRSIDEEGHVTADPNPARRTIIIVDLP